jgi:O-antigen ligase
MSSTTKSIASGILFRPYREPISRDTENALKLPDEGYFDGTTSRTANLKLAYAGLFIFTLLLYARPQEMFPETLGNVPLVKIVAAATLVSYIVAKLVAGERLTIWTIEIKMVLVIVFLGILFTPIAASPDDSLTILLDTYLKVVVIFILMINLLNTAKRLRSLITLSVICGTILALFAIFDFISGNFIYQNRQSTGRIVGIVSGMFGNANDLALSLNLLIPFSVSLALTSRASTRILYFICTGILAVGVIVTFSRGGFLGLVTLGGVLFWKLSRRNRGLAVLAFLIATGFFLVVMPAGYSGRLTTILSIEADPTGSAQARRELLDRAIEVASHHPLIGIGMGNYHIYSLHEQVAHNSYLEISAELGVAGLIAYLILIFAPLRSLRRIERDTKNKPRAALFKEDLPQHRVYYLSIALQASFAAYLVCSFFGSVEYLWHIYYLVAYAIALRHIYQQSERAIPAHKETGLALEKQVKTSPNRGILWQPRQRAKG